MSDVKFVIGIKNSEPAPPEFEYYCGAKPPITNLFSCVVTQETVWDADPDCAEVFRSTLAVADALGCLTKLFPHDTLFIDKRVVSYERMDTKIFLKLVQTNRIADILKGLGADEIEYLQDNGVLDLTNVT